MELLGLDPVSVPKEDLPRSKQMTRCEYCSKYGHTKSNCVSYRALRSKKKAAKQMKKSASASASVNPDKCSSPRHAPGSVPTADRGGSRSDQDLPFDERGRLY